MESGILDWVLLNRVLPSVLAWRRFSICHTRSKLLTGDMEGSKCTIKMGKYVHEGEIIGVGKQLRAW